VYGDWIGFFFNTPSQAAMVTSLPKEHWGTAVGIINAIFGLGHLLGISLSAILLTIAFRYYSGEPAATPHPGDGGGGCCIYECDLCGCPRNQFRRFADFNED